MNINFFGIRSKTEGFGVNFDKLRHHRGWNIIVSRHFLVLKITKQILRYYLFVLFQFSKTWINPLIQFLTYFLINEGSILTEVWMILKLQSSLKRFLIPTTFYLTETEEDAMIMANWGTALSCIECSNLKIPNPFCSF